MSTATREILALARSFPLLQSKLDGYNPECFSPSEFERMSRPWSTTERHLAEFILSVWNPHWAEDHDCSFDLVKAKGLLSQENLDVLAAWVRKSWCL
jgi:hypothetical protein